MLTVASSGVPGLTRASGMVPKANFTLSSSSSSVSSTAVKVKDWDISPELNVTLSGTPE